MKKLFYFLSIVLLTIASSCGTEYDDSELIDRLNKLEEEQKKLEEEQKEMQEQIDAQQALIDALTKNLTITSIVETNEGYVITFSDNSTITFKQDSSFIENIEVEEDCITFTFADGRVVTLPLTNNGGNGGSGDSGEVVGEDNKIYYTTSDNTKLFPKTDASLYGAILISNTYKDGQGVLVFDDAVTKIGEDAFRSCERLTSVTIPDSVTTIGKSAFNGCTGELIINSKIIETDYTYNNYPSYYGWLSSAKFTKLTIGDSVTTIGNYAFYNCSSLTSVTIGDSVTTIGNYAFNDCSSLQEFNGKFASEDGRCLIIDGVLNSFAIGCGATEYTIPNSVTEIGDSTFDSCSSLTSVTIPDSVTTIGNYAFQNCSSLTSVYISDIASWCNISFMTPVSNPLYNARNLYLNNELVTDLVIPDSVTEIGDSAFRNCDCLTSITIPDSVTTIGGAAFYSCDSLTSITIPDSVTMIGDYAFSWCESLTNVYCKATTPPAGGSDMFYNNASGRKIYVPMESVEAYRSAEGWSSYKSYIVGYNF